MSMFGLTSKSSGNPARNALAAALAIWEGLEKLNNELSSELAAPLRIGIGIHVGVSIVGWTNAGKGSALQFLGDTGNIAAKLEEQTKILRCTLAVSSAATSAAGLNGTDVNVTQVSIPGKSERLAVATFDNKDQLMALLASTDNIEGDANCLAGVAR